MFIIGYFVLCKMILKGVGFLYRGCVLGRKGNFVVYVFFFLFSRFFRGFVMCSVWCSELGGVVGRGS